MHRETELSRGPDAPRQARQALAAWYGDSLRGEELDAGKLLVSELVTNAVAHGVGRIRLAGDLDDDRLRVEVGDEGSGLEQAPRGTGFRELRGHGLTIVGALASRWGIREGTTHVWAEIGRPGPRPELKTTLRLELEAGRPGGRPAGRRLHRFIEPPSRRLPDVQQFLEARDLDHPACLRG
jgi:anti-sigma regulatory factor (Ser/Thr protein kinase)